MTRLIRANDLVERRDLAGKHREIVIPAGGKQVAVPNLQLEVCRCFVVPRLHDDLWGFWAQVCVVAIVFEGELIVVGSFSDLLLEVDFDERGLPLYPAASNLQIVSWVGRGNFLLGLSVWLDDFLTLQGHPAPILLGLIESIGLRRNLVQFQLLDFKLVIPLLVEQSRVRLGR